MRREPVVRYGGTKQVLAQTLPSRAVVRVDRRRRVEVEATMQSPSSRLTVGTASSLPSPSRASVLPTFFDTTPASLSSSAPLGAGSGLKTAPGVYTPSRNSECRCVLSSSARVLDRCYSDAARPLGKYCQLS